jgi:hypothetical protein
MRIPYFIFFLFVYNFTSAQNYTTNGGNSEHNGISKYTAPNQAQEIWNINNAFFTDFGNAIYAYNDRFVTTRIATNGARIQCFNISNGAIIWTSAFKTPTSKIYTIGFTEDAVYAHDYDTDSLFALNPSDGTVKWKSTFKHKIFGGNSSAIYACNGDLIVQGVSGAIKTTMRLNKTTGDTVWTNSGAFPGLLPPPGFCAFGNTMYRWTGGINSPVKVVAIDMNSGTTKYASEEIPGQALQQYQLIAGPDGTIYVWRDNGLGLYAFTDNGTSITVKWIHNGSAFSTGTYSNLGFDKSGNIIEVEGGKVYRLNKNTGAVLESTPFSIYPTDQQFVGTLITIDDNEDILVSGGGIPFTYLISKDLQTIKWQAAQSYNPYAAPVLTKNGTLLNLGSGTGIKAYRTPISRKPVADFLVSTRDIIAGGTINFVNQSSYNPTEWRWKFYGATPDTSNDESPTNIQYNTAGEYEVRLITLNSIGKDTLIKSCYIKVLPGVLSIDDDSLPSIVNSNKSFQIFPNPTTTTINVRNAKSEQAFIYDIQGHLLGSYKISQNLQPINVRSLLSGTYAIRIGGFKKMKTFIFLKE